MVNMIINVSCYDWTGYIMTTFNFFLTRYSNSILHMITHSYKTQKIGWVGVISVRKIYGLLKISFWEILAWNTNVYQWTYKTVKNVARTWECENV